jgi:hypothetical protein
MLFHIGMRGMFEATRAAIETVLPVRRLKHPHSRISKRTCGAINDSGRCAEADDGARSRR